MFCIVYNFSPAVEGYQSTAIRHAVFAFAPVSLRVSLNEKAFYSDIS